MHCASIAVDAVASHRRRRAARRRSRSIARPASSRSSWSARPARSISARSTISRRSPRCAASEELWFHVDGAFGALAILSPELAPLLAGIEHADSIALDFHKWGQVPYDAGFLLVRDGERHRQAFAQPAAYLRRETRGLAARRGLALRSRPRPVARLPRAEDLVHAEDVRHRQAGRGDRAKLRAGEISGGARAGGAAAGIVGAGQPQHRLLPLSRRRADRSIGEIVADVQESGIAAPSSTTLDGRFAIRAAIVNHRTDEADIDALVAAVLEFGARRTGDGLIEVEAPPLAAQ